MSEAIREASPSGRFLPSSCSEERGTGGPGTQLKPTDFRSEKGNLNNTGKATDSVNYLSNLYAAFTMDLVRRFASRTAREMCVKRKRAERAFYPLSVEQMYEITAF